MFLKNSQCFRPWLDMYQLMIPMTYARSSWVATIVYMIVSMDDAYGIFQLSFLFLSVEGDSLFVSRLEVGIKVGAGFVFSMLNLLVPSKYNWTMRAGESSYSNFSWSSCWGFVGHVRVLSSRFYHEGSTLVFQILLHCSLQSTSTYSIR